MTDETTCRQCTGPLPAAGMSRRALLNRFGMGLGGMALANLVNPARLFAASAAPARTTRPAASTSVLKRTPRRARESSAASFTTRRKPSG